VTDGRRRLPLSPNGEVGCAILHDAYLGAGVEGQDRLRMPMRAQPIGGQMKRIWSNEAA
jgi:hypothetical protein